MCLRICVISTSPSTAIYTLSLHDALPIFLSFRMQGVEFDNGDMYVDGHKAASDVRDEFVSVTEKQPYGRDRKSGSAGMPRPISYAVFCLKKKKKNRKQSYVTQI